MDRKLALKIIADLGLLANNQKTPEIEVSSLRPDTDISETRNILLDLESAEVVDISHKQDRNDMVSLDADYYDIAKRTDLAMSLEYDGDTEKMLEEDPEIRKVMEDIESSVPQPREIDGSLPDIGIEMGNRYALALYPFGTTSLNGLPEYSYSKSRVSDIVGLDLSEQIDVLNSVGYLEKSEDGYRLNSDEEFRRPAENIVKCVEREYDLDMARFWSENERSFL